MENDILLPAANCSLCHCHLIFFPTSLLTHVVVKRICGLLSSLLDLRSIVDLLLCPKLQGTAFPRLSCCCLDVPNTDPGRRSEVDGGERPGVFPHPLSAMGSISDSSWVSLVDSFPIPPTRRACYDSRFNSKVQAPSCDNITISLCLSTASC